MRTLLLDTLAWDLVVDATGNIAVAAEPYSQSQDAASEVRTFAGEVYFDTSKGIPYFEQVLGKSPPLSLVRSYIVDAALLVPGVTGAQCYFTGWTDRRLSGQIQVTNSDGATSAAGF